MKGNKVIRLMSFMMTASLAITHLTGEFNLLESIWLWLAAAVSFMAFQSTFTSFCPASKMPGSNKSSGGYCSS